MTQPSASPNGTPPPVTLEFLIEALKQLKANGGVDRGKLKFGEMEDLEDILIRANHPRSMTEEMSLPLALASYRYMRGVLWLWLRREHSHLQFDDFREIDQDTLLDALGDEDEDEQPDPTEAPAAPSSDAPTPTPSPASATSGG
jgi:hypothetical protein